MSTLSVNMSHPADKRHKIEKKLNFYRKLGTIAASLSFILLTGCLA